MAQHVANVVEVKHVALALKHPQATAKALRKPPVALSGCTITNHFDRRAVKALIDQRHRHYLHHLARCEFLEDART